MRSNHFFLNDQIEKQKLNKSYINQDKEISPIFHDHKDYLKELSTGKASISRLIGANTPALCSKYMRND